MVNQGIICTRFDRFSKNHSTLSCFSHSSPCCGTSPFKCCFFCLPFVDVPFCPPSIVGRGVINLGSALCVRFFATSPTPVMISLIRSRSRTFRDCCSAKADFLIFKVSLVSVSVRIRSGICMFARCSRYWQSEM